MNMHKTTSCNYLSPAPTRCMSVLDNPNMFRNVSWNCARKKKSLSPTWWLITKHQESEKTSWLEANDFKFFSCRLALSHVRVQDVCSLGGIHLSRPDVELQRMERLRDSQIIVPTLHHEWKDFSFANFAFYYCLAKVGQRGQGMA